MTTPQTTPVIDTECLALNAMDDMEIRFVDAAGTKALVIDNVYRDPDYVRGLALSLDYDRRAGAYPGSFAFISISASPLLDLVNSLMRAIVGDYLAFTPTYGSDLVFAIITARGADLSPGQRRPHADGFCDYAGLVYLNPAEQCYGGTSFWRHRLTGIEMATDRADVASLLAGPPNEPNPGDALDGYLTESTETWELTQVLPMAYNRFVAYDSSIFHTPHYSEQHYGTALPARRLTQNVYFDKWQARRAKMISGAAGRRG